MLGQKPIDTPAAADTATIAPSDLATSAQMSAERVQAEALRAINELTASPEFQSLGDSFADDFKSSTSPAFTDEHAFTETPIMDFVDDMFSPFLTSPYLDDFGTSPCETPFSDFMPTPHQLMSDTFESPLIADNSTITGDFSLAAPLFGGVDNTTPAPAASVPKLPPTTDKLWTISPQTPALDSIDAPAPSASRTGPVIPPSPPRRRSAVTGTRKNIKPEALIPLDAPTQKRTYVTPSATSRKAVPSVFRKRLHSVAFDEEGEEQLEELSPTASEVETIEWKRRQNTLAARKSRKRKLEHQQMLETQVETLKGEVTMWRERALMAQEMLRSHGVPFTFDGGATPSSSS